MSRTITPLHPSYVGEMRGIDLRRPLSAAETAAVEAGMDEYAVLVFPEQQITVEEQVAFSRNFGELEGDVGSLVKRLNAHISDISNIDDNGQVRQRDDERRLYRVTNRLWHSDSTFREVPAKYSLLSARELPAKGGETEFADLRAAYDSLSPDLQRQVDGLQVVHCSSQSRRTINFGKSLPEDALPPVVRPLAHTMPGSGRRSLFLASHAAHIVDWPVPDGRMFLLDLIELATQREFVYRHQWRVGDLVMWDNRCTMHRSRPYDETERRVLRRTTVKDIGSHLAMAV